MDQTGVALGFGLIVGFVAGGVVVAVIFINLLRSSGPKF